MTRYILALAIIVSGFVSADASSLFGKVIEGTDVVPKINQNDTVSKARVTSEPGAK